MPTPAPWRSSCEDCETNAASGVWEGYEEDFFLRPVHKWRFAIEGTDSNNVLSGTVTFGDAAPLEPALDPDGQYPVTSSAGSLPNELQPGATYTIVDGATSGEIVRFKIARSEVMKTWCELQTSYRLGEGAYYCLPGQNSFRDYCGSCRVLDNAGDSFFYPEAKCDQCHWCACDESSCTAYQQFPVTFDLTLDAEAGTLIGTTSDDRSLRLVRVEDVDR